MNTYIYIRSYIVVTATPKYFILFCEKYDILTAEADREASVTYKQ